MNGTGIGPVSATMADPLKQFTRVSVHLEAH